MRKKLTAIIGAAFMACLLVSMTLANEEMIVPMGEITLEPLSGEGERSPVTFPHAVHFSYNCQQCHHAGDKEQPIVGCTTSGCHDLAEPAKDKDGKLIRDRLTSIRYFKNAFHGQCIGCHQELKKKALALQNANIPPDKLPATGPTGCIECHPKE